MSESRIIEMEEEWSTILFAKVEADYILHMKNGNGDLIRYYCYLHFR